AELHDVQPVLSERRPHGRCGVRLTGGALELDDCGDLLHDNSLVSAAQSGRARTYAFSTWAKSSSTDVVRPNIDSETLSFCLSAFTSSTFAEKLANGPSTTRTFSPGSNDTRAFALPALPPVMLVCTPVISRSGTGVGFIPPRNPVILGVFLTKWNVRSSRTICTNM